MVRRFRGSYRGDLVLLEEVGSTASLSATPLGAGRRLRWEKAGAMLSLYAMRHALYFCRIS